jgi:hypothetical protein
MSGIECPKCGTIRKIEQAFSTDGWHNPPCWYCGDAGWINPGEDEGGDPFESYHGGTRLQVQIVGHIGQAQWRLGSVEVSRDGHRLEVATFLRELADAVEGADGSRLALFIPSLETMRRKGEGEVL